MEISDAIYIKLGEGGRWEHDSLQGHKIRFGWRTVPIEILKTGEWPKVREIIENDFSIREKKSGSTNDFNALRRICQYTERTVFVTFHGGKLFWCSPKIGSLSEDNISKYIEVEGSWKSESIDGSRVFELSRISGRLTKYQGFLGTSCQIGNTLNELTYLKDIINGKETQEFLRLEAAKTELKMALVPAIQSLTPKDFEILIDLVFRNSGWRRTSVLGETMKFFDLILEEPFTKSSSGKFYGVQIKSRSDVGTFRHYCDSFENEYKDSFKRLFFVVHSPDEALRNITVENSEVELLLVPEIADLCIDGGLVSWVMEKSR